MHAPEMSVSGDSEKGDTGPTCRPESPVASLPTVESDLRNFSGFPDDQRATSPVPSCISMRSEKSLTQPPYFSGECVPFDKRATSPVSSCISMKSAKSLTQPPYFSGECVPFDKSGSKTETHTSVHQGLITNNCSVRRSTNTTDALYQVLVSHKSSLKRRVEHLCEDVVTPGSETLLNSIYTELYITKGESEGVNEEHEVHQIEAAHRRQRGRQETPIKCNDIFSSFNGEEKNIRTVMTKGIAGIGKTVSVHKFILDWAEGATNQDVDFIFVFPFREMNLVKDEEYSLHQLLLDFYPELKELDATLLYERCKILFIFDGLDESRMQLHFHNQEQELCDVTHTSSVGVVLTNLLQGNLLPSALIWITSRPAAANQIPAVHIGQVTELRGFNDPQKDEYFRKRIRDQAQAEKIISHIKTSRSLYIMCHIPVFCWISATVLQEMLHQDGSKEIPRTLTEMFIHLLIIQTNMKNQKYDEKSVTDRQTLLQSNKDVILKLSRLAFNQLENGNVLFYEEDLTECDIDVTDATVYSGMCTELFKEEPLFQNKKIFCFVHLSMQEFLAAFFLLYSFLSSNMEVLESFLRRDFSLLSFLQSLLRRQERCSWDGFLKAAVDKTLHSDNGQLDLFLRFLLGISLPSNQNLLQGLLPQTESSSESLQRTSQYIKEKISENISTERATNLLLCLLEMKDTSLLVDIEGFMRSGKKLSATHCSALAYMIMVSEDILDDFNLKKYNTETAGCERLIVAVRNCRKARLVDCDLTEVSCKTVASALQSPDSHLTELNMSNNNLLDSGVKHLSLGLESACNKLESLRLHGCQLSDVSCSALSSAVRSAFSSLRVLDLSTNFLKDSGVKLLSNTLQDPHCKLETLLLQDCDLTEVSCEHLSSALKSNSSKLKELDLSYNEQLQDSGVTVLCTALEDAHCQLLKLELQNCNLTDVTCSALCSALKSNSSSLRELNLGKNKLQDSGVIFLCKALEDPRCKLEKLSLQDCNLSNKSCAVLCSALGSNTCLKDLNLSDNDLQDSGVKHLFTAPQEPPFKLEKLKLQCCNLTDKSCEHLASALTSILVLKELDLSYNNLKDSGVNFLATAMNERRCQLKKLWLQHCKITDKGCSALSSAFRSNSSLQELDVSNNELKDTGLAVLCGALEDPQCKLRKLQLQSCVLTVRNCEVLSSALRSNTFSLRELDLSYNKDLQLSAVKLLLTALEDPQCKLEKLLTSYGDLVKF
ncbi:LOW QUALITY PROTEIN: NACHT, LRR and PYD domains-containing protein 3-like [Denticeps clupeoides]|uniref:LOW QUALITY PROTEIN: NACHT, LRR and PYD domains-containing protein 3-like n=1 Tax=Denticeps clupeoides TaxID=299321 RepID=UPI0010A4BA72|nr:LOW QUALITY PROTEIN: NACHT, LRR and PYD domains-containing protein 3-like [Denticeps clupeoides]